MLKESVTAQQGGLKFKGTRFLICNSFKVKGARVDVLFVVFQGGGLQFRGGVAHLDELFMALFEKIGLITVAITYC